MRNVAMLAAILIAGLALAQGTGESPPASEPVPPEPEAPVPHRHKPVPPEARAATNPFAGDAESADRGRSVFSSQCTMCHGAAGDGTGDLVERLSLEMPDFTDPAFHTDRTDGELYWRLAEGCGRMLGQKGRMTDKERWDLVSYVRALRHAG